MAREKLNFKTTKVGMDKPEFIPDKDALLAMLDTVTTPEGAYYAQERIVKRLAKIEASDKVIMKVKEFASHLKEVSDRQTTGSIWTGSGEPLTDFKSLQQFLAEHSVETVKGLLKQSDLLDENGELKGELQLDFAINDDAQFVRGYKLNGQPIKSKAMIELLDDVFKAWLAEKGMFYKNGQLVDVDDMGKIKQNENGKDVLMQREEVFNRLQDDKNGFSSYLKNQGIQSKVVRRAFPEAESEVDRKEDVKQALKSGKRTEGVEDAEGVENKSEEEVAPSEPERSGPSGGSSTGG